MAVTKENGHTNSLLILYRFISLQSLYSTVLREIRCINNELDAIPNIFSDS